MMLKTVFMQRAVLALSICLSMAACVDEEEPTPDATPDTGTAEDSSGGEDTALPDANDPTDAGTQDVAPGPDAAVEPDAIAEPDTAVEPDATVEPDTATEPDAATDPDVSDSDIVDTCDPVAAAIEAFVAIDSVSTGTVEATTANGVTIANIDASAGGSAGAATNPWIYVSLADAAQVSITDVESFTSAAWDLGFKRSSIRLNSGDSGPGPWMVARADELPWADAIAPPGRDAEWKTDDFVADDCTLITEGRGTPATAFSIWYDYNPETHAVTPTEDVVFFLYRMDTHTVYRLQITGWSSGLYTVQWATL